MIRKCPQCGLEYEYPKLCAEDDSDYRTCDECARKIQYIDSLTPKQKLEISTKILINGIWRDV